MKKRKQMEEWRDDLKKRYYKQGKELTEEENGRLLLAYFNITLIHQDDEKWSDSKTIAELQQTWPLASATITNVVKNFMESEKCLGRTVVTGAEARRSGRPKRCFRQSQCGARGEDQAVY